MSEIVVTRFAPSPTGFLHLGHAFSALFAWRAARARRGRFLLRIEDIDRGRCRPDFEAAILEDLSWLGIDWDGAVRRQSACMADYADAIKQLEARGLLYPCFCTRAEIGAEIENAGAAPHGPDGPHYPGTCKRLSADQRESRLAAGTPFALRLDMNRAADVTGPLTWRDVGKGDQKAVPDIAGDVVIARKDTPTSYHLAVTLDDHIQGVSLVTRGYDLFHATHVHRALQALLGLVEPVWQHHPLITDSNGRRLAKRHRAMTVRGLRQAGKTAAEVRAMVGME